MYKIEDNYKFSNVFMDIDYFIENIEPIIDEFLTDGLKLVEEKQKKMDEMIASIDKIDPVEAEIFDQHVYEPERIKNILLKNSFLSSGLSYIFSQFEYYFKEICIRSMDLYESKISLDSYTNKCAKKMKGLNKPKNYLIDTYKIQLDDKARDWEKIENFYRVRNYFIHANGNVIKDLKIVKYIEDEPNISLFGKEIILTKDFIIENSYILINYLRIVMDRLYENRKSTQKGKK
jgi:hypothetical protein